MSDETRLNYLLVWRKRSRSERFGRNDRLFGENGSVLEVAIAGGLSNALIETGFRFQASKDSFEAGWDQGDEVAFSGGRGIRAGHSLSAGRRDSVLKCGRLHRRRRCPSRFFMV